MNRRSFFRVMPIAASPVALAGAAVAYSKPKQEAVAKELPPPNAGVSFSHGTPAAPPTNPYTIYAANMQKDVKDHGGIVMHEGELFIKKPGGPWRQIS